MAKKNKKSKEIKRLKKVKSSKPSVAKAKKAKVVKAPKKTILAKVKKEATKKAVTKVERPSVSIPKAPKKKIKLTPFLVNQQKKLQSLRDSLLDQMQDVAQGNLRAAPEGGGGAAFGQHMGDAGSDAYEKDFALSLLSQEQDSLNEIEDALQRIEDGTFGVCEKSGKTILKARLEALPWARYTVECQAEMEKAMKGKRRWDSTPQFMDMNDSSEEEDDEEGNSGEEETRVRVKED